ncbi:MAG TPA: MlaD family protein [Longimicrobiales bacterium]|nr:MlaD family protein [Longimicrobiales bacterium]
MEIRRRYVIALGLLVVVAGILFVWGLYYLLNEPPFKGGHKVYLALDNGAGLKRGDRVVTQGVQIGSVRSVELDAARKVTVELRLDKWLQLPVDTRATIRTDVFGANTVELIPGGALAMIEEGDTLGGAPVPEIVAILSELGGKASSLLETADSLLSPKAVADVHAVTAVLPESAEELRGAFRELHFAAAALRRSVEGLESAEVGSALNSAIAEVESSARALSAAIATMERSMTSLASVLAKIDAGQGTLGRLVNDSTLYWEMSGALREVRALAADVRERPQRYVSIKIF